jgi:hypothetical protein
MQWRIGNLLVRPASTQKPPAPENRPVDIGVATHLG